MSLIFRQLQDARSSTYTYLLGDSVSKQAILIDPVLQQVQRDCALVRELGLKLSATLDTHVHADHVTGAALVKQATGCAIMISAESQVTGADRMLSHGDKVHFGGRYLEARATPGHTNGCMTFVLDDKSLAFTGDALLIRGAGRTDFQQGNAHTLFNSVYEQIFSLPMECLIYPGHDYRGLTCSSVGEEKQNNPRLGGTRCEEDFVGYMDNLGLPHPAQIDIAVPANLKCGDVPVERLQIPDWAPLEYTYAGIYEIDPYWLNEYKNNVQIIDVRAPDEFNGILGHIDSAKLIPLEQLRDSCTTLSKEIPIVAVCRSGGRSAQAVTILEKNGFEQVANLAGGMINWQSQGLPVQNE